VGERDEERAKSKEVKLRV